MYDKFNKQNLIELVVSLSMENTNLKKSVEQYNNSNTLFSNYIIDWLELHKHKIASTTYNGYYNIIHNHIYPYFKEKNISLSTLSILDIEKYYSYKIEQGLSPSTIKKHHANINKSLNYAVKIQLIDKNSANLVDLPPTNKSYISYYNLNELIKLFYHFRDYNIYPIVLLCSLGLRRSEALAVKWSDIDFDKKTITIDKKINPITNKLDYTLKSNSSYRVITLPEFFINEFLNIRNSCIYNKDKNFVATNKNGDNISCSSISHSFHYYINHYNLKPITLKGLRHTCATIISNSGFNLKYVQEWLGHSTITITANTYTHINMSDKKKVAYTLDKNINSIY